MAKPRLGPKAPGRSAPPATLEMLGRSGLLALGGRVLDEWDLHLQGNRGRRALREMADQDPIAGAILYALEMLIRQVHWSMDPADDSPEALDNAIFINNALSDMEETWPDTLAEILTMLVYGWSYFEILYKERRGVSDDPTQHSKYADGLIGWRAWAVRSQESLDRWEFAPDGTLLGMWQIPPPDYRVRFIPYSKALLFRPTVRRGNPEGRPLLRNAYRCFSEDTQLLTERGWVGVAEIGMGDQIATISPDGTLAYQAPTAIHSYPYDGELLHISSTFLDQLVTPNHRLYVKPQHAGASYRLVEADQASHFSRFKRDVRWEAPDVALHTVPAYEVYQTFKGGKYGLKEILPPITVPMDDWLTFLGIFLSDGCTWRRGDGTRQAIVLISQKPGEDADTIRALLARLPWSVYERPPQSGRCTISFEISSVQLWHHLAPFGKAHDKYVPDYVKALSARQARIFLDAYVLGDGTPNGKGRSIGTVSRRMADDLAELALKSGYVHSIGWQPSTGIGYGCWRVNIYDPAENDYRGTSWESVPYQGTVHCVTVPNHTVYARRNDKACWSGNSYYMAKNIETIEAIGAERDLAGFPVLYVPPNLVNPQTTEDREASDAYYNALTSLRRDEQEGLMLPAEFDEKGHPLYEFKLITSGGQRAFNTASIIDRHRTNIAQTVLADFLQLGHSQRGAQALSLSKIQLFSTALAALLDAICSVINTRAIPALLRLNGRTERFPTLGHGEVERTDLQALGTFIYNLSQAGADLDLSAGSPLLAYLLEEADLPASASIADAATPSPDVPPGSDDDEHDPEDDATPDTLRPRVKARGVPVREPGHNVPQVRTRKPGVHLPPTPAGARGKAPAPEPGNSLTVSAPPAAPRGGQARRQSPKPA